MKRHDEMAEKIITTEGLTFALASASGKKGDLEKARAFLKKAIVSALDSEFNRGCDAAMSGDV